MPASIVNLGPVVNIQADKRDFGLPEWSAIHTATATALSAGPAAVANRQHFLTHARVSFSAAPSVTTITVKDGTTVIDQIEVSASAPFVYDLNYEKRPLCATVGAALTVNVGSAGGSVVQTLTAFGFTDIAGTQTSV